MNPEAIKENTNSTTVRRRIEGGDGDDVLHTRPGNYGTVADTVMDGGSDRDIFYGGDDDDTLSPAKDSRQRDQLYFGEGEDVAYLGSSADKIGYVDDSCEKKDRTVLIDS